MNEIEYHQPRSNVSIPVIIERAKEFIVTSEIVRGWIMKSSGCTQRCAKFHAGRLHILALIGLWAGPLFAAPERQPAAFRADDGHKLFADYYPAKHAQAPAPAVILLHMYKSDRTAWVPLVEPLHTAGFAVLALDYRGHGESATSNTLERVEQRDTTLFREVQQDLDAAYHWLAAQPGIDRSRLALVGASVGCSIALEYAARDRSVDAIVCLSPGTNYLGLPSEQDIRQIQGRQILLVATADERAACDALAPLTKGTTVKILPGASHGTQMLEQTTSVLPEIVQFLDRAVGSAPAQPVFGTIKSNIYHQAGSAWIQEIRPENLRVYSSAAEAEARGLRASRSKGPKDRGGRRTGRG